MGFMSDTEFDIESDDFHDNTPPSSPRAASSHAEAVAESSKDAGQELSDSVVRDYAALCCREFGLTDTDKDDILKTSQMATRFMAVRQYIRVVALAHNVNQLLSESFLESAEFRDHVTRRIQATFLDAALPTYVRGCTARLIQHMQENPASWRIPPIVHAHFLNSKAFRKAVAAVASNFRGDMRRKIQKSIKDNLDIGALAKKLCVKGYQPTNEHWRRFALLRDYMTDWEKLPCRAGKGRGISFWAFIDTKLDKLRARCVKSTAAETQNAMKTLLKANLKDDQERFAGPSSGRTKLPARILLPEWQRDHAKAVNDMSEYIVDSNVEDDIDEDDSVDGPDGADAQAAHDREQGTGDGNEHDTDTENRPGRDGNRGAVHVPAFGAGSQNQTGNVRTGTVLVPETQSQDGAQATSDQATNRGITAPNGLDRSSRMELSPDTQSTQLSFVPATQQQSASLEASRTPGSSGSSGQATQSGWASGTLVDRRTRSTHGSSSPLACPGSSSVSQVRRG